MLYSVVPLLSPTGPSIVTEFLYPWLAHTGGTVWCMLPPLSPSLCVCMYVSCPFPALCNRQNCTQSKNNSDDKQRAAWKHFLYPLWKISLEINLFFLNRCEEKKPQEDTFSPQCRHDVFWNIVPCFKWELGVSSKVRGPGSRLFSVFCFVKKYYF